MTVYSINGNVKHTIILGAGYGVTFTVEGDGSVTPVVANANNSYTGIASLVQNAYLINQGLVYGSNSPSVTGHGVNGGTGVNLALAGDHFSSSGGIVGGAGGNSLGTATGYGNDGGTGGTGVNLIATEAASSSSGFIRGGVGGNASLGYTGGGGGIGVNLSGATLTNSGSIAGGQGGSGYNGAAGGVGASLGASGTLVDMGTLIVGGAGGHSGQYDTASGGAGGAGLEIGKGGSATVAANHVVNGGDGGVGDNGGNGGTGVVLYSGGSLQLSGSVMGGAGGASTALYHVAGSGGAGASFLGGYGATLNAGAIIKGGNGGNTGGPPPSNGVAQAGAGGIGLDVSSGLFVSSAAITGGSGGYTNGFYLNSNPIGGIGGVGIDLTQGAFFNEGSITGGQGGASGYYAFGNAGNLAAGGAGAYLNGGSLIDYGRITGGAGGKALINASQYRNYYAYGPQGSSVAFGPNAGTLVLESSGSLSGNINNFAVGDTIDIKNMTPVQVFARLASYSSQIQINSYTNGVLNIYEASADAGDRYHLSYDPAGKGTDLTLVACYVRGTRIATALGERCIESLRIGDRVMTSNGILRAIRWIARRSYSRESVLGNLDLLPIRIRAGALADGIPHRDLWVSPEHAMYMDAMLIPARALVNGLSIVQEMTAAELSYFHVEFDTHDVIIAEGALSESFIDDDSRAMFDNAVEFHRLYPQERAQPARFCAPRIEEGEKLEHVRQRLKRRAESESVPSHTLRDRGPLLAHEIF